MLKGKILAPIPREALWVLEEKRGIEHPIVEGYFLGLIFVSWNKVTLEKKVTVKENHIGRFYLEKIML